MSVVLTEETFATLVGRRVDLAGDPIGVALFEISEDLMEEFLDQGWSGLVQFKMQRSANGLLELEMRRV